MNGIQGVGTLGPPRISRAFREVRKIAVRSLFTMLGAEIGVLVIGVLVIGVVESWVVENWVGAVIALARVGDGATALRHA
ncbi:MAG: hypothetical protein IT384_18115 [Deltaproteobacteria bacterium]|nr:hypothetical protein [Deltaproteobacteria bacterium]